MWLLSLYEKWDAAGQPEGVGAWTINIVTIGLATSDERQWLIRAHAIAVAARKHRVIESDLEPRPEIGLLPHDGCDLTKIVWEMQASLMLQALQRTNGNKHHAAKLLRMNRTTLLEKIKTHVRLGDQRLIPYVTNQGDLRACELVTNEGVAS